MELRKVNAIIRNSVLEDVEKHLLNMGVKGITVTLVRGYGEKKEVWEKDWLTTHARIEIFTEKAKAEKIAAAIMEVAHSGSVGDGIICILPVEKIYRIRTKSEATPDEI